MAAQKPSLSAFHRLLRPKMQHNAVRERRYYSAPLDSAVPAAKQQYIPTSGTYPKGFMVSGTYVGVKTTNKGIPDLAFLASESPCAAAAVFTKNKFQAAPVTVSRNTLRRRGNSGIRSIIVNSGCANAVTGSGGLEDAEKMAAEADRCFDPPMDGKGGSSLVMSTGVIGQRLVAPRTRDHYIAKLRADYLSKRYSVKFQLPLMDWVHLMITGLLPLERFVRLTPSQS